MKIHLPALGGLLTTMIGVAASPLVLNLIPPHWADVVIAIGTTVQAVTKAIQHQPTTPATPPT